MYALGQHSEQLVSYYDILRVQPGATDEEIKTAYHRLAKRFHPDRIVARDPRTKRMAELRFRLINEAYATLKVKDKRERYNRQLRSRIRQTRKIESGKPHNDNLRQQSPRQKGFFGALFADLFSPVAAESGESR